MVYMVDKYSRNGYSEVRSINAQMKVMDGYAKKMNLSEKDREHLHRFFSPWRVPKEMTNGEVRMIILLMEHVGDDVRKHSKRPGYSQRMTRSGFMKMIKEIIPVMDKI